MFFEFGAEVEPTFNGYAREAPVDEFWIDPLSVEGNPAAIRACFNEFTVTILIERRDRQPITKQDAQVACDAVVSRLTSSSLV